jgi:hypoxanthine phosphoribosyltransferase
MVTLAKGGFPLARILADFLQIPLIVSMGVHFYTGIGTRAATPEIYQDISPLDTIRGKNILLFDDVADSGESLLFAREYLLASGAGKVVTSALYYKEKSKIVPDYFGQLSAEWIVFPFEAMETHRYLSQRWRTEQVAAAEQYQRFLQLGLRESWLAETK